MTKDLIGRQGIGGIDGMDARRMGVETVPCFFNPSIDSIGGLTLWCSKLPDMLKFGKHGSLVCLVRM